MSGLAAYLPILWIFVGIALMARGPRPLAVVLICLLGTLFLPEIQSSPIAPEAVRPIRVPLLEFSKVNAMAYALLLGLVLFDAPRIASIRWNIFDLPPVLVGAMPAISTLINGSGAEVAFAEFRASFLVWTAPYFVGRVYLSDFWGVRLVTMAIAVGGLLYIPLCWLEIRISPTLHYRIFGFQQHEFAQTVRFGGYRPMVFLQHGLAVGLWMVSASLCLYWLWRTGGWPTLRMPYWLRRIPGWTVLAQVTTTVVCKSFGAVALGVAGWITLVLSSRWRTRFFLGILLLFPPTYVVSRLGGWWKSKDLVGLVAAATRLVGRDLQLERSQSLEFRLESEEILMRMVRDKPWFGKGGGVLTRPKDEEGRPIIPDGRWIIAYYDTGLAGLVSLLALLATPSVRFLLLHPPATWHLPQIGPATAAAVVLAVIACDCMFNSMLNPMYFLLMAALNGWNNGVGDPRSQLTLRYLAAAPDTNVAR
jgi:hypothetical protein